jgi:hypothetical protein
MAASVIAAVAALPMLASIGDAPTRYVEVAGPSTPGDGVWVGGRQASNLFVYDAAGNPLSDVQVYDDLGNPVVTADDRGYAEWAMPGMSTPWSFVGVHDLAGRTLWNVYPRQGAPSYQFRTDPATGERVLPQGVAPQTPPRPFGSTPAIVVPSPAPTAQAVPDEGATPTAGATSAAPQPSPNATAAVPTP